MQDSQGALRPQPPDGAGLRGVSRLREKEKPGGEHCLTMHRGDMSCRQTQEGGNLTSQPHSLLSQLAERKAEGRGRWARCL